MNYFNNCQTINEIKSEYRKMCFELHPDLHTDEWEKYNDLMKELNAQYQDALNSCNGQTFFGSDDKEHTYYYNEDIEAEVALKIQMLIGCNFPEHIKIWLIGTWVWVEGTKRDDKEIIAKLKELKLRWHSKRKMWYFRQAGYKRRYSDKSFDSLKDMYGAQKVKNSQSNTLGAD